jgi:tRNA (guanosine-2'-O-)-methyltransferase
MDRIDQIDRLIDRHGAAAVTAALAPLVTEARARRIEQVLDARLASVSVVLENLHDPHNGAACIRSIEALGLAGLHVIETAERFSAAKAVTRGCHKWLAIERHAAFASAAATLRGRGVRLYAAVPDAPDDLESLDVSQPCALVFGNEHAGVAEESIAACDGRVSIRMYGFTESFNLSVSVALAVQAIASRRRAALGTLGDLSPAEKDVQRARWYARDLRGAEHILLRAFGHNQGDEAADPLVASETRSDVDSVTRSSQDQATRPRGPGTSVAT